MNDIQNIICTSDVSKVVRLVAFSILILAVSIQSQVGADGVIVDTYTVYQNGVAADHRLSPWKMNWEEVPTDETQGKALWFNTDGQAQAWAGIGFKRSHGEPLTLTQAWLERGFFRFLLTGGLNRYGSPNGDLRFQIKLLTNDHGYQQVRSRFVDRGRGLDEDPATWQEVLVPLNYWTDLEPGRLVTGLSLQCVRLPEKSFALNEVGLVLYERRPAWIDEMLNADVAQPWVTWPSMNALPTQLRADRDPVRVRDGRFVNSKGQRVFLLNPYSREDPRIVYWGGANPNNLPPNYDLYDRRNQGWLYDALPNVNNLCRLGFNSLAVSMPSQPWWDAVGYSGRDNSHDPDRLAAYARDVKLPMLVDMVCWPWTLGKPADAPESTKLPTEAFTQGQHHWVPYRTIGAGRQAWLDLWSLYAQRYLQADVDVLGVELFNEPAYVGLSQDHHEDFVVWLQSHYDDIRSLNRNWGTSYRGFRDVSSFDSSDDLKEISGLFYDYDAYLAGTMADLVRTGIERMSRTLPQALVGVQPMGGFVQSPHDGIWKHKLIPHETLVLTPTGGGRWTGGGGTRQPTVETTQHPIAAAPLENDLLLSLAGDKMIVDNETYLRGQMAQDTYRRLWEHVIAGLDGLTVFSWSKRGWAWWEGRERLITEADKYPYSCLIPLARRTDALRGIHDFAKDVQRLAPKILPKPWGPTPRIGLLYSWAQARRRILEPSLPDKAPAYYAALKYTHANFQVITSSQIEDDPVTLSNLEVLIVGGIDTLEPAVFDQIRAYVDRGGCLLLGEAPLSQDLYGQPLAGVELTGVTLGPAQSYDRVIDFPERSQLSWIKGPVKPVSLSPIIQQVADVQILLHDRERLPVIAKRSYGRGKVYTFGIDVIGYSLAKILWTILDDALPTDGFHLQLAKLSYPVTEHLAPNVLLSRRSYDTHHALLLQNRDAYEKTIVLRIVLSEGHWQVREALAEQAIIPSDASYWTTHQLMEQGITLTLSAEAPVVVLIEKK